MGWNPVPSVEHWLLRNAPAFLRGRRLLFVADLHIRDCTPDAYIHRLAGLCAEQGADLLLLGGDLAESIPAARRMARAFCGQNYPRGIIAVPGNNDVEAFGSAAAFSEAMPFPVLVNERMDLPMRGGVLRIGGIDERKYGHADARGLFPRRRGVYDLLLSHYPCVPDFGFGARPRLMLCGHTHGGQLRLGGITPYLLGLERGKIQGISGIYEKGGVRMLVSPGVGVSKWPIRLGAAPKIHCIEFC